MIFTSSRGKTVLVLAAILAVWCVFGLSLAAQTEKVMHSFTGSPDGSIPQNSGLLFFQSDYYGVTLQGGASGNGAVYQLMQDSIGAWQEIVIYSFPGGAGGSEPMGTLIADAAGNFYGATVAGGSANSGVIFELHNDFGQWQEIVLHNFTGGDGSSPEGSLLFDKSGNLFGTTTTGGAYGGGTVFELSPSNGEWTETVLHSFGQGSDGFIPMGSLIFDSAGNLYGVTRDGGSSSCIGLGCGTVFQLVPGTSGWTENIIHNFQGRSDGFYPNSPLAIDGNGNLYGSTQYGGGLGQCPAGIVTVSCGTVYELSPSTTGAWNETILHRFIGGNGGSEPSSPLTLTLSDTGNLYGETAQVGSNNGTIFRLAPKTGGGWAFKVLFTFNGTNGANPQGGLIVRRGGTLYGTTIYGGSNNDGVAFQLIP